MTKDNVGMITKKTTGILMCKAAFVVAVIVILGAWLYWYIHFKILVSKCHGAGKMGQVWAG